MIRVGEDLTASNIYKYVSSYEIFKKYSKNFKQVGKKFLSDFREEKTPSCMVVQMNNDLLYTDFGLGKSFRAIGFVMELFGISYYEALDKINNDFGLGLGISKNRTNTSSNPVVRTPLVINAKEKGVSVIQIKSRDFLLHDIEYWGSYGISISTLKLFNVCPVSNIWVNGNHILASKYSYSYNFYVEDGVYRRKIYQPFSHLKWISNGGKVVQGEVVLPKKGNLLIITKSMKDVMCLYEMGYTSIAPPAETMFLPEEYFVKQRQRFNKIYILYDNDEVGIAFANKFASKYSLNKVLFMPKELGKDVSDCIRTSGLRYTKAILDSMI